MNILKKKPGVIILPASVVCIIFIVLLVMLISQKQSNNALFLEYRASKVSDLLLDLYINDRLPEPDSIDQNIIGFGLYDLSQAALYSWGSAPVQLPPASGRHSEGAFSGNKTIIILRPAVKDRLMPMINPNMQRRMQESLPAAMRKYQMGLFLEYSNSSYISERRLILLIILLSVMLFGTSAVLIFRLYRANRKLLISSEHDKQLIQLGQAARTLAHEIRNPLSALKIQRDLLVKKLPSDYRSNLEVIDRELKRLNTLVDKVGEFLRNPVGKPEELNLADFVNELYASRDDVSIEISGGSTIVSFDRDRLRTVLDNVINNAVEAGGNAALRIKSKGMHVTVEVCDNGEGFSDEALKRSFDPFYTSKDKGTGLGLSVVNRLMESTGGRVEVVNLKEGGASVTLVFGEQSENTYS